MIAPRTFELTAIAFQNAVDRLFSLRGAGSMQVRDLKTAEVITQNGDFPRIQIDDALAIVLNCTKFSDSDFAAKVEQRRVGGSVFPLNWRYQFKRIIKMISPRRLHAASAAERKLMVGILAYARAALSFKNNRPNGLAAAIATLRSLNRIAAFAGEFAADIDDWEGWDSKQRKLASLRGQMKRIEGEISMLAA